MTSKLFEKLNANAIVPERATAGSAGYDICAEKRQNVEKFKINKIYTGIKTNIPLGHVGLITSRSSLALKHGCQILGGVIDSDYTGEIIIMMTSLESFNFDAGTRIAQMIIMPFFSYGSVYFEREGGFGSTGL